MPQCVPSPRSCPPAPRCALHLQPGDVAASCACSLALLLLPARAALCCRRHRKPQWGMRRPACDGLSMRKAVKCLPWAPGPSGRVAQRRFLGALWQQGTKKGRLWVPGQKLVTDHSKWGHPPPQPQARIATSSALLLSCGPQATDFLLVSLLLGLRGLCPL